MEEAAGPGVFFVGGVVDDGLAFVMAFVDIECPEEFVHPVNRNPFGWELIKIFDQRPDVLAP